MPLIPTVATSSSIPSTSKTGYQVTPAPSFFLSTLGVTRIQFLLILPIRRRLELRRSRATNLNILKRTLKAPLTFLHQIKMGSAMNNFAISSQTDHSSLDNSFSDYNQITRSTIFPNISIQTNLGINPADTIYISGKPNEVLKKLS